MKRLLNFTFLSTRLLIVGLLVISATHRNVGYQVGDNARDFKLKNIDGSMVSLADYQDAKGFIVIFTCNHCPYSKIYENRIILLDKKYKPRGYPVIAINPNDPVRQPQDSYKNMKIRAKRKGFTFPYLVDETQEITAAYGARYTPHVFVLNKSNSNLKVAYIGAIDDNYRNAKAVTKKYVEDAVDQLLANQTVVLPFTKALGCSIKWKDA